MIYLIEAPGVDLLADFPEDVSLENIVWRLRSYQQSERTSSGYGSLGFAIGPLIGALVGLGASLFHSGGSGSGISAMRAVCNAQLPASSQACCSWAINPPVAAGDPERFCRPGMVGGAPIQVTLPSQAPGEPPIVVTPIGTRGGVTFAPFDWLSAHWQTLALAGGALVGLPLVFSLMRGLSSIGRRR